MSDSNAQPDSSPVPVWAIDPDREDPDLMFSLTDEGSFGGGPHSSKVFRALRNAVWSGQIKRGEPFREKDFQEALGIGRMHVRDAIKHLSNQGLVYTAPGRRGVCVTVFSKQDIIEFYTVREVLEGAVARLAALNATDDDIRSMWRLQEKHNRATDPIEIGLYNNAFHNITYRAARNQYLLDALGDLESTFSLIRDPSLSTHARHIRSVREHHVIVDAIEQRDAEGAEAIGRLHVRNSRSARLRRMSNN